MLELWLEVEKVSDKDAHSSTHKKVWGRLNGHQQLQAAFYIKIIPNTKKFKIDSAFLMWAVSG